MSKQEFLEALAKALATHGVADREATLDYYREMIEDRIESGLSEAEAVAAVGPVSDIVAGLLGEDTQSTPKKVKQGLHGGILILLALGAPLWIALLSAGFAILLSLAVTLWSLVISAYSVFLSLAAAGVALTVAMPALLLVGEWTTALLLLGGGLFCIGCAIFAFFGCLAATRGSLYLTKQAVRGIGAIFKKRRTV
jgi:uncharacterized membrane protein